MLTACCLIGAEGRVKVVKVRAREHLASGEGKVESKTGKPAGQRGREGELPEGPRSGRESWRGACRGAPGVL